MTHLTVEDLVKRYRGRAVVNGVSLHLSQGEVIGLLGPNGAGKTTTFYMIAGLIPPDQGRVTLAEHDLTDKPMHARARLGLGYLAQEPSIFRRLTVGQNVIAILETRPDLNRAQRIRECDKLLHEFGIRQLRDNMAISLSGGERRRLEIARALASEPKFILLDEPFAGIDPIAVADLQTVVSQLRDQGLGVLITDHNVRETLHITDRAYILFEGRIELSGSADEIVASDKAREIYLGEKFRL